MSNQYFILKNNEYPNGMFPIIPDHNKKGSWFLLTDGITDDIIVSEYTTVKQIRQGKYKRLVEISKIALVVEHQFNSYCKETSYTFAVQVKAMVSVSDPIIFYNNTMNINFQDFINNQFYLDVGRITRKYSILDYNGIDDELTSTLTSIQRTSLDTGLSYQISTVMTQPNAEAMKILKEFDDMNLRNKVTELARTLAEGSRGKTYEDAIREDVAKGVISETEAIKKIDEYNRQSNAEKIAVLLQLRKEGILTDKDIDIQKQFLLSRPQSHSKQKSLPKTVSYSNVVNTIYNEGE